MPLFCLSLLSPYISLLKVTEPQERACTAKVLVTQLCPTLCGPHGLCVALQAPLSMKFSRQEYQRGYLFPFPGDLPDPGIKPGSPALQVDLPPGKPTESVGEGIAED